MAPPWASGQIKAWLLTGLYGPVTLLAFAAPMQCFAVSCLVVAL
jgi:hypothetical protein